VVFSSKMGQQLNLGLLMNKRKSISKKIRFNVFKRDLFTCQYCGDKPPKVILELDHITPVCEGGDNDQDNLITACFDCNRGKSGELLTVIPEAINDKAKKVAEKELQLKEFGKLKASIKRRKITQANKVASVFTAYFPEWELSKSSIVSIKLFLDSLHASDLCDYMELACERKDSGSAFRYFCGICWNKIKRGDE
jgi:hypothetical protein